MALDIQVPIRLPKALTKRADALLPALRRDPDLDLWGDGSRAQVLRMAIRLGLDALEAKYEVGRKKTKGKGRK